MTRQPVAGSAFGLGGAGINVGQVLEEAQRAARSYFYASAGLGVNFRFCRVEVCHAMALRSAQRKPWQPSLRSAAAV